jgi:putative zinc finger/helix-turn-helix YgiT family protein
MEARTMQRCVQCKSLKLRASEASTTRTIAGRTFTATVPAVVCGQCGEVYLDGAALERVDLHVAAALATAGERAGEALKFMRKALGYSGRELATLLDVTVESVSRWETGRHAVDADTVATLAALADDRLAGRTTTRDRLLALREPRPVAEPQDLGRIAAA